MMIRSYSILMHFLFLISSLYTYKIAYAHEVSKDGFYVGVEGRYVSSKIEIIGGNKQSSKDQARAMEIYGGYEFFLYNNFYLAPEIGLSYSLLSINKHWRPENSYQNEYYRFNLKYYRDWMIEPRIRIGYAINGFIPYIFTGINLSHEKFSSKISKTNRYTHYKTYKADNDDFWRIGFKIGAGMELALINNMSIRFEGAHIIYQKKDINLDMDTTRDIVSKVKNDFQFSLGLSYHF